MSTDIWGYVEIKKAHIYDEWDGIIALRALVQRSYGMFGSLFGVRNAFHGFRPIAPERGAPEHVSVEYGRLRDIFGPTKYESWVLWSELVGVDWYEEGQAFIDEEGKVRSTPERGGKRERRKDYVNGGWALLFEMMALLARDYGAENVRLTVWFD